MGIRPSVDWVIRYRGRKPTKVYVTMKKLLRKSVVCSVAAGVAAGSALFVPVVTASPALAGQACDPGTTTTVRVIDSRPLAITQGTWRNTSKASATIKETSSASGSLSASVTAEAGISASAAVATANAQVSAGVTTSASVTKGQEFTINVPANSSGAYSWGIEQVRLRVNHHQIYSNCDARDYGGTLTAPRMVHRIS